jgi:hypothetical protein
MLHDPREHPQYDEALDVLCDLSPFPLPLKDLAEDHGYGAQSELSPILKRLRSVHKIDVQVVNHGQRVISVARHCWPRAEELASRYFQTVYESALL